jgi:alpha-glucosidase (family GH31 glycosyl hydrolase)
VQIFGNNPDSQTQIFPLPQVSGPQQQHYQRDLFQEAAVRGYLVQDRSGRPYMVQNTSFSSGMVDLTNPQAAHWLKDVIKTVSSMVVCGWRWWGGS